MWGVLANLHAGRRVALLPRFTVDSWADAVERHRPRASGLVPAAVQAVLDAGVAPARLASLEVVICGAAPISADLATAFQQRYGARVLTTYGATEFAGAVAGWTLPLHKEWWERKAGSTGRPYPGVELRVVSEDGAVLPAGTTGHLELRTAQSPQGGSGWQRTSDLAEIDEDGFLWVRGRADDVILRGGFKVDPEVVRAALERHPAVREAAVAGLPDPRLGQVPVAVVELAEGATPPDEEELRALCREQLTPYEVPVRVLAVAELPRTPALKVSRVDLLQLFATPDPQPATTTQGVA
jgi:long-chain acyl-CoA synthetase